MTRDPSLVVVVSWCGALGLLGGIVLAAVFRKGWGAVLLAVAVCVALPMVSYLLYLLSH
jgi:hypothetical protein